MSNRVAAMIETVEKQAASRIDSGQTTQEALDKLHSDLDMNVEEFVKFQELKSLSTVTGYLSLEEGQLVYAYLGESPDTFNSQPLAVKVILTKLFQELLTQRIKAARATARM